jgi:NAD-dependent dihydropyrimidine dehydrogenase PreA subunit
MPWLVGYPREKIDWFPTIDKDKCVGCGMCMNCGRKVFDWIDGKAVVARPYECVVGCNTCQNLCRSGAITFPEIREVRKIYGKHKIWDRVKEKLISDGVIADAESQSVTRS